MKGSFSGNLEAKLYCSMDCIVQEENVGNSKSVHRLVSVEIKRGGKSEKRGRRDSIILDSESSKSTHRGAGLSQERKGGKWNL